MFLYSFSFFLCILTKRCTTPEFFLIFIWNLYKLRHLILLQRFILTPDEDLIGYNECHLNCCVGHCFELTFFNYIFQERFYSKTEIFIILHDSFWSWRLYHQWSFIDEHYTKPLSYQWRDIFQCLFDVVNVPIARSW